MSVDSFITWAWQTGLAVSLLIVLVLVCRRAVAKKFGARAAYALWALPVVRFVLPEIPVTINLPAWLTSPSEPVSAIPIPTPTQLELFEAVMFSPVAPPVNWQIPLLIVWLSVAIIYFIGQIRRQYLFMKAVRLNSVLAAKPIQAKAAQACKVLAIKTMPELRIAANNIGPLVAGIFRPVVILPHNFETKFNAPQQIFALTHELAHIRRGDLWAAFGALIFRALNWPNPLVHMAAAKFRIDQEAACDATVLKIMGGGAQTKQNYAATLIHAAKLTKTPNSNPNPNPNAQILQTSPLCLTIYHPLKERLMTLKTSKTNSTMLSRIGAGALLVTALTLTAPVTFAGDPNPPKTNAVKVKTKKVIKFVDNTNGVETAKHYEITTEDGVTTAYSIDEHGNRTVIDASEVKIVDGLDGLDGLDVLDDMNVFVMDGDGSGENLLKIIMGSDMDSMQTGQRFPMKDGAHSKIIVRRLAKDADGNVIDMDNEIMIMGQGGDVPQASMMVGAAQRLLERAESMNDDKELSAKTRRKLEKARKALKEAQEALEAEE